MKKFFKSVWAKVVAVLGTVAGVALAVFLVISHKRNKKTQKQVVKAAHNMVTQSSADTASAAVETAVQEGKTEAVVEEIKNIEATTETGSAERVSALADSLKEMRRKHEVQ